LEGIRLKDVPKSIDAAETHYLQILRKEWQKLWDKSPRKVKLETVDNSFPFDNHRKFSRAQASVIFQLRTRHIPLNAYLHKIGKSDSSRCEACWRRHQEIIHESVQHFSFECPEHFLERSRLEHKLGRDAQDLQTILKCKDKTLELIQYIRRTKRLQSTLGKLKEPGN